jgi:hypothetical protein
MMTAENKDEASASTSSAGMYKVLSFYSSFIIFGFYTAYQCCAFGFGSVWIQNFWLGPDPKKKNHSASGQLLIQNEFEIILL